jgi:hypothetical protein
MAITFTKNPTRTISKTLTLPLPKTIALGGVATGNIKAQEAANVAGTIKNAGLISRTTDADCKIGKTNCVVAVLEVNSVSKVMTDVTAKTITDTSMSFKP